MSKYKNISTKVSENSWAAFLRLCEIRNITPYEFLQNTIEVLIRQMDDMHKFDDTTQRVCQMFDEIAKKSFNLCDPENNIEVQEATYYVDDASGEKHGCRGVLVKHPFFDQAQMTWNENLIAERMFCLLFPKLYRYLRVIGAEEECNNVCETIDILVRDYLKHADPDSEYITSLFSDNRRGDFGQIPHEGQPYKRINNDHKHGAQ